MEPISEPWSFHVGVVYENICSMKDTPSQEPRDEALRAALHDAGLLAGLVQGVFHASYSGSRRDVYLATLGSYLADLGGSLESRRVDTSRRSRIAALPSASRPAATGRIPSALSGAMPGPWAGNMIYAVRALTAGRVAWSIRISMAGCWKVSGPDLSPRPISPIWL